MTSVLNVDTIADKAGTGPVALTKQVAAKATIAASSSASIYDSFNISSGLAMKVQETMITTNQRIYCNRCRKMLFRCLSSKHGSSKDKRCKVKHNRNRHCDDK